VAREVTGRDAVRPAVPGLALRDGIRQRLLADGRDGDPRRLHLVREVVGEIDVDLRTHNPKITPGPDPDHNLTVLGIPQYLDDQRVTLHPVDDMNSRVAPGGRREPSVPREVSPPCCIPGPPR